MTTQPHALYRFFDASSVLLYIGITADPGSRWKQHRDDKPWWVDVGNITVETYPDRTSVLAAERAAILAEKPLHNVVYNRRSNVIPIRPQDPAKVGAWTFRSIRSGIQRTSELWLYPELDCSACVDDVWDDDGQVQLDYYIEYIRKRYSDLWDQDAVPIYWTVMPAHETAPFTCQPSWGDFLHHYTWPTDSNGQRLDWLRLPIINDRFPEFASALGWTPAPFQPTAPLRSIMTAKWGASQ